MSDEKSLSSQFDSHQQHPRRRWTCPSDEAIASYVDGTLANTSKSSLETHLVKCQRCRQIVANTVKDQRENDLPAPPSTLLYKTMHVASTQQRGGNWFWIPAGAAAMIVLVLLVISGLLRQPRQALISPAEMPSAPGVAKSEPAIVSQKPVRDIVRKQTSEEAFPSVIFPRTGSVVAGKGLKFAWKQIPRARFYEVRVVTFEGDLVWEGQSDKSGLVLPSDFMLKDGKYFVWITSYLSNGRTKKSSPVAFVVRS